MNIVLLGKSGMLGSDLAAELVAEGHHVIGFDSKTLDITNRNQLDQVLSSIKKPDFIINCAAYTKVDACESNREQAMLVNGFAVEWLAEFCQVAQTPLVHFSTDYVFDGQKIEPYVETDFCNPINFYGESKRYGEEAILNTCEAYYIVRLQWLYGKHGPNFVETILKKSHTVSELNIVNDQWGSPSSTADMARCIVSMLENKPKWGIYHLANQGHTTWFDFASFFLSQKGINTPVNPVPATAYVTPAKRPENSRLSLLKYTEAGCRDPLDWQKAVSNYLKS